MEQRIEAAGEGSGPAEATARIQAAIDAVHAAGGGRVSLRPGRHVSGSLELKSGVELRLEHGSRLLAADDPELFPPLAGHDPKLTANRGFGALLQARDARDVLITGSGTIDGGGAWDAAPNWLIAQGLFRPAIGYFEGCRELAIEGVRIVGAKWWNLHLRRCEGVRVRGLRIRSNWPNSDGIDPDGCRNVTISDCQLQCGDDCIVAKSTQGDPCENIVVSNCILETNCACFKLGTESRGPFRNIALSNCVMRGEVCFALYMKDGGLMENILGSNLVMDTRAPYPIVIDAMARDYRAGPAGTIRNVQLSHCLVRGPGRVWLEGPADQPLENIRLESLDWVATEPLPERPDPKPLGSARVTVDPARPPHEDTRAQVVAVNVAGLQISGLRLSGPGAAGREC